MSAPFGGEPVVHVTTSAALRTGEHLAVSDRVRAVVLRFDGTIEVPGGIQPPPPLSRYALPPVAPELLFPHQLQPLLAVLDSEHPRLLVADETGTGKTRAALAVLLELTACGRVAAAAIFVPRAVLDDGKWQAEMRKFGIPFVVLESRAQLRAHLEAVRRPAIAQGLEVVLLPTSLLTPLAATAWPHLDLVIVDEAHHLRSPRSRLHRAVRQLLERGPTALLLTATPVQTRERALFALLRLLRPDLFPDLAAFRLRAAPNRHLHRAAALVRGCDANWRTSARTELERAAATPYGAEAFGGSSAYADLHHRLAHDDELGLLERLQLAFDIAALTTLRAVVSRITHAEVAVVPERRVVTERIAFNPAQWAVYQEVLHLLARIAGDGRRCMGDLVNLSRPLAAAYRASSITSPGSSSKPAVQIGSHRRSRRSCGACAPCRRTTRSSRACAPISMRRCGVAAARCWCSLITGHHRLLRTEPPTVGHARRNPARRRAAGCPARGVPSPAPAA